MTTCSERWPAETAERYLQGRLEEAEASAYEEHFFACEDCFATLRDLRALREALARSRRDVEAAPWLGRRLAWASVAAAVLVLGSSGAFWLLRRTPSVPSAAPPAPVAVASPVIPDATQLAELARVDPPRYEPLRLRGHEDAAAVRFRKAMEPYARGTWAAALPLLTEASRLDPKDARSAFYEGACALLVGRAEQGIDSFRRVVALGETPYLEEARFYLAKAYLGAGDLQAARGELNEVVRLEGDRRDEARRLLERLDAIGAPAR